MATNEAKIKLTAEDVTAAAFASVLKNVSNLKGELAALPAKFVQIAVASAGIGSIAGFASMITGVVESRAKLAELSIQTNISVEALSSLNKLAKLTDTPIEDIASASNKLSKALFSQTEDSKGAAAAIQALGLNFDKFKSLTPDQQLYEVAKALDNFRDGSEKSAVAMLLFGKSGATMLPFLKELSENGLQAAKVTTQQAEEARQLERDYRALKAAGDEWKKTLADDMLPTLVEFSRELVAGRQAYGGWFAAIVGIGTTNPFGDLGANLAQASGDVKKFESELAKSQGKGLTLTRPEDVIKKDLANARAQQSYLLKLQTQQALDLGKGIADDPRIAVRKPTLQLPAANQNADAADALLKRIYQGQFKAAKDAFDQEKELADFRNKVLKGDYDDGLKSLTGFYADQNQIRAAGVAAELAEIDKEIAAAQTLKSKSAKPETRQQADNAIADATARRALVVQKAAHDDALAIGEEQRALKALAFTYYDFLANSESLKGDELGAAAIKRVKQVQDAQDLLTKVGFSQDEATSRAAAFGLLLQHTDQLRIAQADYNRLVDSLGVKEKDIALDSQASGASELDTLRAVGAERQKQIPLLQALADKAMAEAQAIGSPDAILAAQKLNLALKQAVAEVDPLFTRLREIGKEAADDVTKDAEDALVHWQGFRNLINAIDQDLVRLAARKLFTEPLDNWLTGQIGGNGQSSGGGGILGGLLGNIFNPGGTTGGPGAGFSSDADLLATVLGGRASGGPVQAGSLYRVNEMGAEMLTVGGADYLMMGAQPGHVTPAGSGGGGNTVINITVPGGTSRQTADQVAGAVSQALARSRRNA